MALRVLNQMIQPERRALMRGNGWWKDGEEWKQADSGYTGNTPPIERFGVPPLKMNDGSHGFRGNSEKSRGHSTVFPSSLALAATWDESIVKEVATSIALEFRAKSANMILGPDIGVHRLPAAGRSFETLSGEDPYLGVRLGPVWIKAVQEYGILAAAKHFCFNGQELHRNEMSSNVDERTSWEIYYPPFEAAVQAGVGAVMCSSNKVNTTPACESQGLLRTVLKHRMGFLGFVLGSWFDNHFGIPPTVDMTMPEGGYTDEILDCVEWGQGCGMTPKEYDANVYNDPANRILRSLYKVRLDETYGCHPHHNCTELIEKDVRSTKHAAVARKAAAQSIVLLKNSGVLPIEKSKVRKLLLMGFIDSTSHLHKTPDPYSGGGSSHLGAWPSHLVTPRMGIEERAKKAGIEVTSKPHTDKLLQGGLPDATEEAKKHDLVVIVATASAEEGKDREKIEVSMWYNEVIVTLAHMQKETPVVVVLLTPGALIVPFQTHDNVQGIMSLFYGGEQTGHALADVLFGDVNPSGKLPVMFPYGEKEHWLHPEDGLLTIYSEGVYGSYRNKFGDELAAFAFGHGLSYTTFEYGQAERLESEACSGAPHAWEGHSRVRACVGVDVKNTGSRPGAEVAQLYIQFNEEVDMPRLMLKGFHKTKVLQPGQTEKALFVLTQRDVSAYWVPVGKFVPEDFVTVHIGASSKDLRTRLEVRGVGRGPNGLWDL